MALKALLPDGSFGWWVRKQTDSSIPNIQRFIWTPTDLVMVSIKYLHKTPRNFFHKKYANSLTNTLNFRLLPELVVKFKMSQRSVEGLKVLLMSECFKFVSAVKSITSCRSIWEGSSKVLVDIIESGLLLKALSKVLGQIT